MKTFTSIVLIALVATQLTYVHAGSGESHEDKKRHDTCEELVEEPITTETPGVSTDSPSTEGPTTEAVQSSTGQEEDYHCGCQIDEAFTNITLYNECLTSDQKFIFGQWVKSVVHALLKDKKSTKKQKIKGIGKALKKLKKSHWEIYNCLDYEFIGSWGRFVDVEYTGDELDSEESDKYIVLDQDEDCELFRVFRSASLGDSYKETEVEILIYEIKRGLKQGGWSKGQKYGHINKKLKEFFKKHPDWEDYYKSKKIGDDYTDIFQFYSVTEIFKKTTTVKTILVGSSDDDCPLLGALREAYENTSFTLTIRGQIKQLHDKYLNYTQYETDDELRMSYVSAQSHYFFKLQPIIVSFVKKIKIKISGEEWGSYYDVIFCSAYCHNYGCGNVTDGEGVFPAETTNAPSTTEATSTTPVPTTTSSIPDCSNSARYHLLTIDANNRTDCTDVMIVFRDGLPSLARKNAFTTGTLNRAAAIIWDTTTTIQYKINEIVIIIGNTYATDATYRALFRAVKFNTWNAEGTIGDFYNCGNAT